MIREKVESGTVREGFPTKVPGVVEPEGPQGDSDGEKEFRVSTNQDTPLGSLAILPGAGGEA